MQLDLWLKDRTRWLLNPSAFANLTIAIIATTYAWLTLHLSAVNLTMFFTFVAIFAATIVIYAELRGLARLKSLRGLASGALAADRPNLMLAIREVHRFPDDLAVLSLLSWLGAVGSIARRRSRAST